VKGGIIIGVREMMGEVDADEGWGVGDHVLLSSPARCAARQWAPF
jgi:hypothetical protein